MFSPRPAVRRPRNVTTDVGRAPPKVGTATLPTSHSTSSTRTGRAASVSPRPAGSGVGGTAEACEDLPPLRQVPVPEGVPDGDRACRPGAAAEDLVAAAEVDLGVLGVGEGLEAGVGG